MKLAYLFTLLLSGYGCFCQSDLLASTSEEKIYCCQLLKGVGDYCPQVNYYEQNGYVRTLNRLFDYLTEEENYYEHWRLTPALSGIHPLTFNKKGIWIYGVVDEHGNLHHDGASERYTLTNNQEIDEYLKKVKWNPALKNYCKSSNKVE